MNLHHRLPLIAFCLALAVVLKTTPAESQNTLPQRLSLHDAVRLAMKHNPDLTSARLEVKRSDARVLEAWGNALPAVDVSGQYTHMIDKPVTFFPDVFLYSFMKDIDSTIPKPTGQLVPVSFAPGFSASATLNVRQILFNGAVFIGVGAAGIYSHLARDLYQAKQVETATKVSKAYYGALLAQEALNMMRSSLQNAEDNLKNVRVMAKQGIVSEYDELRASVGVENVRPMVIQSETNFSLAIDNLRNTVGVTNKEEFVLTDSLAFQSIDEEILKRAETLVMEMNPGLSAVKRQIELNGAIINAERSNYLPTIVAFGQYQYQAAKNQFNFSTNDFYKGSTFGLSLSMNLFQGFQTYARVEQAQLEQRKSEEQRVNLERTLQTGLHSILGNLQQARKRVAAQGKTVEMAERGYKIVTTRFLNNSATQLEVNDAQLALTQAKVNRVQAIYDYLVASADLDHLIGRLPSYLLETEEK
ncbi:MAG: TolC family protein [Ignavibacteriales bacterium]|nr:TolC family protein [Ignavibacteriales bacterium]